MVWEWRTPATISAAVGLDLHASAAAIALLAAPEFAVDGFEGDGYAGGESGQRGHQAFAVGLSGRFKSKHSGRKLSRCVHAPARVADGALTFYLRRKAGLSATILCFAEYWERGVAVSARGRRSKSSLCWRVRGSVEPTRFRAATARKRFATGCYTGPPHTPIRIRTSRQLHDPRTDEIFVRSFLKVAAAMAAVGSRKFALF